MLQNTKDWRLRMNEAVKPPRNDAARSPLLQALVRRYLLEEVTVPPDLAEAMTRVPERVAERP